MPDHHLLNGLFSHGGREKYPPAALNWVLAVPNLIHTYIHTYICAYICIVRCKKKCLGSSIQINGLTIQELKEGEQYKYLGQDESVGYHGPLNKERVLRV